MQGKEKGQIGIVGVEQIEVAKIEGVVARDRRKEGIQKVVTLIVELGVMNAKDLVKFGGSALDGSEIAIVDDYGQRKLPKVVSPQFDLLDSLAQLAHLRLLGVVEQRVLRRCIVQVDLAEERALGVVEVPALRLNGSARLAGFFFFPFGDDVVVRVHVEEPFEQERKGVCGRFLERENFDEVIVEA